MNEKYITISINVPKKEYELLTNLSSIDESIEDIINNFITKEINPPLSPIYVQFDYKKVLEYIKWQLNIIFRKFTKEEQDQLSKTLLEDITKYFKERH